MGSAPRKDTDQKKMIFEETPISGAYIVRLEAIGDDRGFFARAFCAGEFETKGLDPRCVQLNVSFSKDAGTLRGLHWQEPPHAQTKLMRCTRGALWDVVADIRPDSPTWGAYFGVELSADNRQMLFAPEDVAHGFQTMVDDTEALYQVSSHYAPKSEKGLRHDDPRFAIKWPVAISVVSEKDQSWPDFG